MFVVNASRTTLENRCLVVRIYHSAQQWRGYANGKAAGMDVLRIPSHHPLFGPLAQWLEQRTHNPLVVSSTLTRPTKCPQR